jgi:hypothetical protein
VLKMAFLRILTMVDGSPAQRRATCCPPIRFFLLRQPHEGRGDRSTLSQHPLTSEKGGQRCLRFDVGGVAQV